MTSMSANQTQRRPFAWRLLLCILAGLALTVTVSLTVAWRTFLIAISEPVAAVRRPEGVTHAPEFMFFNHTEVFAARAWSISLYSVPGIEAKNPVPTVEDATTHMPRWVKRHFAEYMVTHPWPVHPPYPSGNVAIEVARVEVYGWPLPALWQGWRVRQPYAVPSLWIHDGALPVGVRSPWGQPRHLPTRPLWIGLAVNTVCWGGAVYLLLAGITALRRKRRSRRGLCEACGYDLRGTPRPGVCPECGGPFGAGPDRVHCPA